MKHINIVSDGPVPMPIVMLIMKAEEIREAYTVTSKHYSSASGAEELDADRIERLRRSLESSRKAYEILVLAVHNPPLVIELSDRLVVAMSAIAMADQEDQIAAVYKWVTDWCEANPDHNEIPEYLRL